MTVRNQPERCTGVDSDGCTTREYWSDSPQPTKYKNGDYEYRGYDVICSIYAASPSEAAWSFRSEDYDGATDDSRCGFADTAAECFRVIDEIEDEQTNQKEE